MIICVKTLGETALSAKYQSRDRLQLHVPCWVGSALSVLVVRDLLKVVLYHHVQRVVRIGRGQFWVVLFVKEERIQLKVNIFVVFV